MGRRGHMTNGRHKRDLDLVRPGSTLAPPTLVPPADSHSGVTHDCVKADPEQVGMPQIVSIQQLQVHQSYQNTISTRTTIPGLIIWNILIPTQRTPTGYRHDFPYMLLMDVALMVLDHVRPGYAGQAHLAPRGNMTAPPTSRPNVSPHQVTIVMNQDATRALCKGSWQHTDMTAAR